MEKLNHQKTSRVQAEADFLPQLERGSQISSEKQLVRAVREAIGSGRLRPGMRLPSSRRLAAELHVNRNTVVNALEQLPGGPVAPRLVYVTPSHQFPLGVRLSAARRVALLEWATRHDALILEDDYDSEFRYDAPPCLHWPVWIARAV
jgi:DNA-binding transcriptional MocR family regulator